jgi:hypothetical protein
MTSRDDEIGFLYGRIHSVEDHLNRLKLRLRQLQEEEADEAMEALNARLLMPIGEGERALKRAQDVLDKYGEVKP